MNNVQRCLCHFYTWMRHSKQTATLLLTKHHANFDTSTSAKGYARVCTNCACAIVVLGILLAQARPTMPCIHLVIIGASLSEPHIDDTTGRNHICIIIIIVRPSPARRAWSHEVCRASNIIFAYVYMASVTAPQENQPRAALGRTKYVGLPGSLVLPYCFRVRLVLLL